MPIQDMKDQVNMEMDASVEDVLAFCKTREDIRKGVPTWRDGLSETAVDVLTNSRMNNIFRDHDKTTVCLWSKLDGLEREELWRNVLIGRFLNRCDRLDDAFPIKKGWYEMTGWTEKTPLVNSAAYQLNPGLGKAFNVKRVRECVPLLDTKVVKTYEAVMSGGKTIKQATEDGNKAFGGYVTFMMFQAVLDIATLYPGIIDPTSEIIFGQGAHATQDALGTTMKDFKDQAWEEWEGLKETRPDGLYDFDVENIFCEFRKYIKRQQDGIPGNRRYKGNRLI